MLTRYAISMRLSLDEADQSYLEGSKAYLLTIEDNYCGNLTRANYLVKKDKALLTIASYFQFRDLKLLDKIIETGTSYPVNLVA